MRLLENASSSKRKEVSIYRNSTRDTSISIFLRVIICASILIEVIRPSKNIITCKKRRLATFPPIEEDLWYNQETLAKASYRTTAAKAALTRRIDPLIRDLTSRQVHQQHMMKGSQDMTLQLLAVQHPQ